MNDDIKITLVNGMAMLSIPDLVKLLKVAGGEVVKGELKGMRRKQAKP